MEEESSSWWNRHKKKVYIGTAIAAAVVIPFGTLILPGLYYKIKGKPEEDSKPEEKKEIEDEKKI